MTEAESVACFVLSRIAGTRGRLVPISQRVRVNSVDVRSDLSHGQRAGGSLTTGNFNIVADEADGTGSGAMAVFPSALEFDAN